MTRSDRVGGHTEYGNDAALSAGIRPSLFPLPAKGSGDSVDVGVMHLKGGIMDFSAELDGLQQQVVETKSTVRAATTESREQLRQRVDQAQVETYWAAREAQKSPQSADAQNKWAKMRADASGKMDEVKAHIDKRNREMDAAMAADEADAAEADAIDAIHTAAWTLDNARVAMLDAVDARAYAAARASGAL